MSFKILDCTLRDGGYYTNWDFSPELVHRYICSLNKLPVDYLEVGYRSIPVSDYRGEFFYCPEFLLRSFREKSEKKVAVMLNEKDVKSEAASQLMEPCTGLVDMVRMAVAPENIKRAVGLAEILKKMGFEVAMNLMYMSTWKEREDFQTYLPETDGVIDCICIVDSFGGVYPEDIREAFHLIRSKIDVEIGFHGHNNLELALINSLAAIDCGASMVDGTLTGMGRGAGNLKTELLLTALSGKKEVDVDFSSLSSVVDEFSILQRKHEWGTNLPYMVSGANSLPQKDVMSWISKRFFSLSSIVRALENRSQGIEDNAKFEKFEPERVCSKVLLVGGGELVKSHAEALRVFLFQRPDMTIIHSSSRNALAFSGLPNPQIHCLCGNEGLRLESIFVDYPPEQREVVLPPYPRPMGTYVPDTFKEKASELKDIQFTTKYLDSVTAVVLQVAIELKASSVEVIGYDGYSGDISKQQMELFQENDFLFQQFYQFTNTKLQTLTKSDYTSLEPKSIYSVI